jgi:glycosyltransferase involved in cell wall biosynthesis
LNKNLTAVTTLYKAERYLPEFLNNLLCIENRDDIHFLLMLNDANQDEVNIVNSFVDMNPGVIEACYSDKVESIAKSLNKGFSLAKTPLIAYADVDDTKLPNAYLRMMKTLERAEVTYGDYIVVKKQGEVDGMLITSPGFDLPCGLSKPIFGPTHCFRRDVLTKVGYWDEQLKSGADFDWQIRASHSCKIEKTLGPITYYTRDGSISASQTKWYEIDALKISLRYGLYNKLPQFQHRLPEIIGFDASKLFFNGQMHALEDYWINYQEYLLNCGHNIGRGVGIKQALRYLAAAIQDHIRYSLDAHLEK